MTITAPLTGPHSLEIAGADEVAYDAWAAFADFHPGATPYHTPQWAAVLTEAFGLGNRSLFARREGRVVGMLPLYTRTGTTLSSSPFRDQGGLLASDDRTADALLAAAGHYPAVEIKQGDRVLDGPFSRHGFTPWTYWLTSRVALPNDPRRIWSAVDNKVRGKVRQAERSGLRIDIRDDAKAARQFHALFWRTRRALGVPSYDAGLFDAIARHLVPSGRAAFLFAMAGERPAGGMVVLRHRDLAVDAYAASRPDDLARRPNDLLVWAAIRWAIDKGCRLFDFGADSPHQESLLQFKRKWLAETVPLTHYRRRPAGTSPPDDPADGPLARLAARILPVLPAPLYRVASRAALELLARSL